LRPSEGSRARRGQRDSSDYAFEQLRALIVWGQLPPGTPIAERIVADRLTRVIARYGERGSWHAVDLTSAQAVDNPRRKANV
jgi:hypothetical protein